ncbi:MAG: DUF896 domain-containing protein [Oscillospiraceae bacterium]
MTKQDVTRINELAAKSRTETGLTEAEKAEQAALRGAYIAAMKQSLMALVDCSVIVDVLVLCTPLKPKE